MPQASLPYGASAVQVEFPEGTNFVGGGGGGARLEAVPDQEAAVREAIANPIGLPRVRELVRPGARVLVAFDDPTVTSFGPVRRLAMEAVLDELAEAGVGDDDVTLLCAGAGRTRSWSG